MLVSRSQCSSPGATGISGLHSRRTRGDRHSSRVEAKNPALLSNRDADQARAFGAVDAMLARLAEGWIHSIQGQPVFFNRPDATWYDIPAALEGWIALWERISVHYRLSLDLAPLARLAAKLHHGTPVSPEEVAACAALITACKRAYRKMDVRAIGSLVRTQMIANQIEMLEVRS